MELSSYLLLVAEDSGYEERSLHAGSVASQTAQTTQHYVC